MTYEFDHPLFGRVKVVEHGGSSKFSFRWREGTLHLGVPAGVPRWSVERMLDQHSSRILAIRPAALLRPGWSWTSAGGTVEAVIVADPALKSKLRYIPSPHPARQGAFRVEMRMPAAESPEHPAVVRILGGYIRTIGEFVVRREVMPRAEELARQLGLRVDEWKVSHGRQTLGTCFPRERRINLSYLNAFLPPELRDYIICHELAHLTCGGHGSDFHRLCDRYCGGREAELARALRRYAWPVPR